MIPGTESLIPGTEEFAPPWRGEGMVPGIEGIDGIDEIEFDDLRRVLAHLNGSKPKEYIDLRVEGWAYYK